MTRHFYTLFFVFLSCIFSLSAQPYTISGSVTSPQDDSGCFVTVTLTEPNGETRTTLTDINGQYTFADVAGNAQGTYSVSAAKDTNPLNGVSTFDIVLAARHILGIELLEPYKILALDVNGNNQVTTLDMVLMRRLILGIDQTFPVPSWQIFVRDNHWPVPGTSTAPDLNHTFDGLTSDIVGLDFFAVKTGDANASALYCQ